MNMRKHMAVTTGLAMIGIVGAACSNSPSAPSGSGGTRTTARLPPRQLGRSSTSTTTIAVAPTTTTTIAVAPTTTTTTATTPTLGVAAAWARVGPSVTGFGQVKPSEISLGGDPTGVITGITWLTWGGATAVGSGTSTYVLPGQATATGVRVQATVEAFDLGTCGGAPAYKQVKWYFPGEGESLVTGANSTINACSGP